MRRPLQFRRCAKDAHDEPAFSVCRPRVGKGERVIRRSGRRLPPSAGTGAGSGTGSANLVVTGAARLEGRGAYLAEACPQARLAARGTPTPAAARLQLQYSDAATLLTDLY